MFVRRSETRLLWTLAVASIVLQSELRGLDAKADQPAPRGVLSGQIVDESGAPVTDAKIDIWEDRGGTILTAKADEDGRYHFDNVKNSGSYRIKITAQRCVGITKYKELAYADLKTGAQVVRNFTLKPACRMRMQILDEQGKPVPSVSVYHKLATDDRYSAGENATTDKQGWVMLGGLEPSPGKRLVLAFQSGYAISQSSFTLTDPQAVVEERVVLARGEKVKGKVFCSDGKPAAGWHLYALPAPWQFGIYPNRHDIGADGSFELTGIVPGEYDLNVAIPLGDNSSTMKSLGSTVTLPTADGPLVLKLDHPSPASMAFITGKITFVGGKPPDWCSVSAESAGKHHWLQMHIQPGKPGFQLGPLPRGLYTLRFQSADIEPVTLEKVAVPSENMDVKITVRKHPLLRGSVVRADTKQPVAEFRARVSQLQVLDGQGYAHDGAWHDVNDKAGSFSLEVINAGIYTVQIASPGLAPTTSEPINTIKDGKKQLLIELGAGASLSGMVVDQQDRPVDGARVAVLSLRATSTRGTPAAASPRESAVETDRGKFVLDHLQVGAETLKVTHPDYCFAMEKVNVNADPTGEPLKIVLKRGGAVRGEVYDEQGQVKPNVTVYFHREGFGGSPGEDEGGRFASAVTDDNGHYEVRHLPAELCSVLRSDEWTEYSVVRQTILPQDGKTRTLDLGGPTRLRGRLLVNGSPLADAPLFLSGDAPFSTLFRARARTNKDGSYSFRGMPAGERTLYYSKSANQLEWVRIKTLRLSANGADLGTIDAVAVKLIVACESSDEKITENMRVALEQYDPTWAHGPQAGTLLPRENPAEPFVIDWVPPGKYELVCTPANRFSIRQVIDVAASGAEQAINVTIPPGTASLSGHFDQSEEGNPEALVWSKDRRLFNTFRPKEDGSYRLENIPAGEYFLTRENLRDPEVMLTFSLGDGEHKLLDLTRDMLASKRPRRSLATIRVLTSEGVPLPGCEISFAGSTERPTLSRAHDGRLVYWGPAGNYPLAVSYPEFRPVRTTIELKPVETGGDVKSAELHLHLQPSDP